MAENTTPSAPPSHVAFVAWQKPPLTQGVYDIEVTQSVQIRGVDKPSFTITREFLVQGPNFALTGSDIVSVFPAEGSLGDHAHTLPHVVLNRTTLPWERRADEARDDLPWLALLVFDEHETSQYTESVVTLGDLRDKGTQSPRWPGLKLSPEDDPTLKVNVIDVAHSLLNVLLHSAEDLTHLAHVRQPCDDSGKPVGDAVSVIIGNRLPAPKATSTAHLVSLAGRYVKEEFDYQGDVTTDPRIRLVSLWRWQFACADESQRFAQFLLNLHPYANGKSISAPSTLQLPTTGQADADAFINMGGVPLLHTLREGSETVSWYHGPLIPWDNPGSVKLPARAADALLRFYPQSGMFDASYAAAWELGRMLTLQSRKVATSLYAWKRAQGPAQRAAEQTLLSLPLTPKAASTTKAQDDNDVWQTVSDWFESLSALQNIPFNYLVPDERLLISESIRFFRLDPVWVDCLLDGAFSIGCAAVGLNESFNNNPNQRGFEKASGFLIRSALVADWALLDVSGYDANDKKLGVLRMDRPSPNILLGLFDGELARLVIQERAEALHFGLDVVASTPPKPPTYYKKLRDPKQNFDEAKDIANPHTLTKIPWRDSAKRILNMGELAKAIQQQLQLESLNAAEFALQMVEGAESVAFQISGTP